ncbi:MAG: cation diffusion facilitator family transporter [Pseudomonadota bacterium]|nr:cation diffusion facilitator family transporter [Pseudomonadota bacterium]
MQTQCKHPPDDTTENARGERASQRVLTLTAAMTVVEVTAGMAYGSMSLLADGWHMATHAAALRITAFAYRFARRHAADQRYTFGTGKIGVLAGFASAVALLVVTAVLAAECILRLIEPTPIRFTEAILVAALGLGVNLVCAHFLSDPPSHDHNLRAAYLHVLADALTSVLAIVALLTGKMFGWIWMDPLMGIAAAALITRWGIQLLREACTILLDIAPDREMLAAIRRAIESDHSARITDLHVWNISPRRLAALVSIESRKAQPAAYYRSLLSPFGGLSHVTIEVNKHRDDQA